MLSANFIKCYQLFFTNLNKYLSFAYNRYIKYIKEQQYINDYELYDNDSSLDILKFSLIMLIVNAILFLGLFYDKFLS